MKTSLIVCLLASTLTASEIPVADCRTEFIDRITFSTERTGVIKDVPREGAMIEPGDVVIQLDDESAQAALRVAEVKAETDIDIRVAEKAAEAARVEYDLALDANQDLADQGVDVAYNAKQITRLRLTWEANALKVDQAKHEKRVAELERDRYQAELKTYRVKSDIRGLVTKLHKHRGEGVQYSESVVEVVRTDLIRVEGFINAADIHKIKVGNPIRVEFDIPGRSQTEDPLVYEGKLGFIDVSIRNLAKAVRVWAEIDNLDGQLREGLDADMTILGE